MTSARIHRRNVADHVAQGEILDMAERWTARDGSPNVYDFMDMLNLPQKQIERILARLVRSGRLSRAKARLPSAAPSCSAPHIVSTERSEPYGN